jgi:hydrogenase/urease accessory protein HupE
MKLDKKNSCHKLIATFIASSVLIASNAYAHAGDGPQFGFSNGVFHFVNGADHIASILIGGMIIALFAKSLRQVIIWFSAISLGFGIYHDVAFYGNKGQIIFDIGFMSAAIALLAIAFASTKLFAKKLAQGRSSNERN